VRVAGVVGPRHRSRQEWRSCSLSVACCPYEFTLRNLAMSRSELIERCALVRADKTPFAGMSLQDELGEHPSVLWEYIQSPVGPERYTTIRHASFGLAIELWHDSMGSFHLYMPASDSKVGGAVLCCFSSGMVVTDDAVCAPELLLAICRQSAVRDGAAEDLPRRSMHPPVLYVPRKGLQIFDSKGAKTWCISPGGSSRLVSGHVSDTTMVISHEMTCSEIVLFYDGLIFAGDEPSLLPTIPRNPSSGVDANDLSMFLSEHAHAPRDPLRLRKVHTAQVCHKFGLGGVGSGPKVPPAITRPSS
jgi:hypothetical protein